MSKEALDFVLSFKDSILIILGAMLGASLSAFHLKRFNKLALVERQISQFYSPMVGLRKRLIALDSVNRTVSRSAIANVGTIPAEIRSSQMTEQREEFFRDIEYTNQQLTNDILPIYESMETIFQEQYWLAQESTRRHYEKFVAFVEKIRRDMQRALPENARQSLPRNDEDLKEMYDDFEVQLDKLVKIKKKG